MVCILPVTFVGILPATFAGIPRNVIIGLVIGRIDVMYLIGMS